MSRLYVVTLLNLYAEYIMKKARLEETQAGIKIAGRNINNHRYADDATLMAEREEALKSFSMKVIEESEKAGLKFNIPKTKIVASSPITSWQRDGERMDTMTDFIFLGSKITAEKAMAPHSSTLAWRIPWTEEPGGLLSMGSHRVGHD